MLQINSLFVPDSTQFMMRYKLLLILILGFSIAGCKKEQNRSQLNAYFNFKVNGTDVSINDGIILNANTFDCILKGDTALFIDVEKQAEGAGFYIRDRPIKDTTYILDSFQVGYYKDPFNRVRYNTSNVKRGTLTIKRGTFQAKDVLNTMSGTFSYRVIDTLNNRIHDITEGSFFMERKEQ